MKQSTNPAHHLVPASNHLRIKTLNNSHYFLSRSSSHNRAKNKKKEYVNNKCHTERRSSVDHSYTEIDEAQVKAQ